MQLNNSLVIIGLSSRLHFARVFFFDKVKAQYLLPIYPKRNQCSEILAQQKKYHFVDQDCPKYSSSLLLWGVWYGD